MAAHDKHDARDIIDMPVGFHSSAPYDILKVFESAQAT